MSNSKNRLRNWICPAGCVLLIAFAAGCDSKAAQGTERAACYPNGTCNEGLVCLSGLCVDPNWGVDVEGDVADTAVDKGRDPGDVERDQGQLEVIDATGSGDSGDLEDVGGEGDLEDEETGNMDGVGEMVDEVSCMPVCEMTRCGKEDGCGGTCECSDGYYCGHGFCIPDGYSYFHGTVQVDEVFLEFNNHPADGAFNELEGATFEFVVFVNIFKQEQHLITSDMPPWEEEKVLNIHFSNSSMRITGDSIGILTQMPADINGAEGMMILKNVYDGNRLTSIYWDSKKSGKYLIFEIYYTTGETALLESGYPILKSMPANPSFGRIMRYDQDMTCWGDIICDTLEWKGDVSFNMPLE